MREPHEQTPNSKENLPEDSRARFESVLTGLAGVIPEITKRPEILKAGGALIDQFELKSSLFDDAGRALVFASIAGRYADQLLSETPDATEGQFIDSAVALLAHKHSDILANVSQQLEHEAGEYSDATQKQVYDRYTDKELSSRLENHMKQGDLLYDVKRRLGVTAGSQDHFQVRALTIGSNYQTHGLEAPRVDYESVDFNNPADRQKVQEANELGNDVRAWKRGLENRRQDFSRELGGLFAEAWVVVLDGEQNLCVTSALAEKLLDSELTEHAAYYDERSAAGDRATLEHEYTHTQGGLNLDGGVTFGINLEELRAEYFSGNKLGYPDIKGFFRDYAIITGHNLGNELASRPKGGSIGDVYGAIASHVGLNELVEVLLASPDKYMSEQSNSLSRAAHDRIGGLDGVLRSLYMSQIERGNTDALEVRITKAAQTLVTTVNEPGFILSFDQIKNYRHSLGLHFLTDMIDQEARQLQAKESVAV